MQQVRHGEGPVRWKRLRVYIDESDKCHGKPLYLYLLEEFRRAGIRGATVYKGVAGYGSHSVLHLPHILRLSEDMPIVVEVVDEDSNIEKALRIVRECVEEGLVTLEDVYVYFYGHRGS